MLANDSDPDGSTLTLAPGTGPGGFKITGPITERYWCNTSVTLHIHPMQASGKDTWAYVADDGTYDPNDKYSRYSNATKVTVPLSTIPIQFIQSVSTKNKVQTLEALMTTGIIILPLQARLN